MSEPLKTTFWRDSKAASRPQTDIPAIQKSRQKRACKASRGWRNSKCADDHCPCRAPRPTQNHRTVLVRAHA